MLDIATAVLITHEHFDHVDLEAIAVAVRRRGELSVIALDGVRDALVADGTPFEQVSSVSGGEVIDVVGVEVRCVDTAGIPAPPNIGYLVGGEGFHPGDSLPEFEVHSLLVPVSGPWVKIGEAIDFIEAVAPVQTIPIHEAKLSEIGKSSVERFLGRARLTGIPMRVLETGQSIEL